MNLEYINSIIENGYFQETRTALSNLPIAQVALDQRGEVAVCKICGQKRKNLEKHIHSEHNMTVAEYQNLFPNALVKVEKLNKKELVERFLAENS